MSGIPSPEFKFGDAEGQNPNTVQQVAKLETYLVSYKDGENRDQVRIAFRIPGADTSFIINMAISGKNIVTRAHPWFHKEFVNRLRASGHEGQDSEAAESV